MTETSKNAPKETISMPCKKQLNRGGLVKSSSSSPESRMNLVDKVDNSSWGRADFDNFIGTMPLNGNDSSSPSSSKPRRNSRHARSPLNGEQTGVSPSRRSPGGKSRQQRRSPRNAPQRDSPASLGKDISEVAVTPKSGRRMLMLGRSPGPLGRLRAAFSSPHNDDSPKQKTNSDTPKRSNRKDSSAIPPRSPGTLGRIRAFRSYYGDRASRSPTCTETEDDSGDNLAPPKRFASMPTLPKSQCSSRYNNIPREITAPPLLF